MTASHHQADRERLKKCFWESLNHLWIVVGPLLRARLPLEAQRGWPMGPAGDQEMESLDLALAIVMWRYQEWIVNCGMFRSNRRCC